MSENKPSTGKLLSPGDTAPDFELPGVHGTFKLASSLEKSVRGVIIYFYPKASTPGCTKEACDFRDSLEPLKALGYEVVGISPDSLSALEKFTENHQLSFPLLSDASKEVMRAYGAWGEKQNYGRRYEGVIRSTFVVGKDAGITLALYNVKASGHVERLRKLLQA